MFSIYSNSISKVVNYITCNEQNGTGAERYHGYYKNNFYFGDLDNNTIAEILSFLDDEYKIRCKLISKKWMNVLHDPQHLKQMNFDYSRFLFKGLQPIHYSILEPEIGKIIRNKILYIGLCGFTALVPFVICFFTAEISNNFSVKATAGRVAEVCIFAAFCFFANLKDLFNSIDKSGLDRMKTKIFEKFSYPTSLHSDPILGKYLSNYSRIPLIPFKVNGEHFDLMSHLFNPVPKKINFDYEVFVCIQSRLKQLIAEKSPLLKGHKIYVIKHLSLQ